MNAWILPCQFVVAIMDPEVVNQEIRVAGTVLELKSKVIDSNVYAEMIVAAVAALILLASVMRVQFILRHWNSATIEVLNFLQVFYSMK